MSAATLEVARRPVTAGLVQKSVSNSTSGLSTPHRCLHTARPTRLFAITFDRAGQRLAAGGEDGKAWLWDLAFVRRRSFLLNPNTSVRAVAFANGGLVAAGGNWLRREGFLKIWDDDGRESMLWRHDRPITSLSDSQAGDWLAAGSGEGLSRLWNLADGRVFELPRRHMRGRNRFTRVFSQWKPDHFGRRGRHGQALERRIAAALGNARTRARRARPSD